MARSIHRLEEREHFGQRNRCRTVTVLQGLPVLSRTLKAGSKRVATHKWGESDSLPSRSATGRYTAGLLQLQIFRPPRHPALLIRGALLNSTCDGHLLEHAQGLHWGTSSTKRAWLRSGGCNRLASSVVRHGRECINTLPNSYTYIYFSGTHRGQKGKAQVLCHAMVLGMLLAEDASKQ